MVSKPANGLPGHIICLNNTNIVSSHAAGMVSAAASGKNISPQFVSVTSVKKKLMLKFSAVKTLSQLEIFSQNIGMRSVLV